MSTLGPFFKSIADHFHADESMALLPLLLLVLAKGAAYAAGKRLGMLVWRWAAKRWPIVRK